MGEYRGFLFAIIFIIIFAGLLASVPVDLYGQGNNPDIIIPIDPALVTDFSDTESFQKSNFTDNIYWYPNILGGYYFLCGFITDSFYVAAKSLFFGFWFGALSACDWTNKDGIKNEGALSFTNIANDAVDGVARYTLTFEADGTYAGGFLFYWNTTTYATPSLAWAGNALYLLHGTGMTTNTDIASLLLGLLLLQLPDCPLLINLLLATPLYACVVFLIWFIIKETLPFV